MKDKSGNLVCPLILMADIEKEVKDRVNEYIDNNGGAFYGIESIFALTEKINKDTDDVFPFDIFCNGENVKIYLELWNMKETLHFEV